MKRHMLTIFVPLAIAFVAPDAHAQIRTVKGCNTRVAKPGKRKACVACIARPRPHKFFKKAKRGKRCRPFKLARAKVAPITSPSAIRLPIGCRTKVVKPGKRAACLACVKRPRPHGYFKRAKAGNRCKLLMPVRRIAPAGGGGVRHAKGCVARVVKPAKRTACLACVSRKRPHAYFKKAKRGKRCKLMLR